MKFDLMTLRPIQVSEAKPRDVLNVALSRLRASDEWVSEGLPRRDVLAEVDPTFINHAEHLDKMISGGVRPDGSSFRGAGGIKSVELDVSEATADVTIKGSLEWDKRPHSYTTRIQFQNFKLISALPEHTWSERARVLLGDNIRVDCDCAAFRYFHRHAATTKGFALIPESRPAHVRNPSGRGGVCKHLEHALKYIGGSYTTLASAMKLSAKRGGLSEASYFHGGALHGNVRPNTYVTDDEDAAREYARDGKVHKLSASFSNPLHVKSAKHLRSLLPQTLRDKHANTHYAFEMLDDAHVREHLKSAGHDAVHFTDQTPKTYKDHDATLVLDASSVRVAESVLSRLTRRLEEARGPRVLYRAQSHGGTSYDETKTKGFGIHSGTEKAARERAGALGSGTQIHKVHVSVHNPIRMKDNGAWSSADIAAHLHRTGKMSTRKLYKIGRQDEPTGREMVTRHLEKLGHDGIVYRNKVEGAGTDSVIALRGHQVKHAGVV